MKNSLSDAKKRNTPLLTPHPIINGISCEVKHLPLKRLFDLAFSLGIIVLGFPLFIIITFLVRITSPGPAIYAQERIGRGGKKFQCYKFRSMYADADQRLEKLLASDPHLKAEWMATHKLKIDPRITPIGYFLRKTSFDELPQFWNVFLGDLSVVGPRPVIQTEIEMHLKEKAAKILSIRPGLTGIWQTSGRNNTTYAERVSFDEEYVDRQSFWLDISLIIKTIPVMIFSKGAY